MSTVVEFKAAGMVVPVVSPLPWERVLEIVGRTFYPDSSPTGPELPKEKCK